MSRSLTIHEQTVESPWTATPGSATTIAELELAVRAYPELEICQLEGGVVLVSADPSLDSKPKVDELARVMFGQDNDAVLVTETGVHRIIDEDRIPVG